MAWHPHRRGEIIIIIIIKATIKFPVELKAGEHMQDELKRQVLICMEIQHLPAA